MSKVVKSIKKGVKKIGKALGSVFKKFQKVLGSKIGQIALLGLAVFSAGGALGLWGGGAGGAAAGGSAASQTLAAGAAQTGAATAQVAGTATAAAGGGAAAGTAAGQLAAQELAKQAAVNIGTGTGAITTGAQTAATGGISATKAAGYGATAGNALARPEVGSIPQSTVSTDPVRSGVSASALDNQAVTQAQTIGETQGQTLQATDTGVLNAADAPENAGGIVNRIRGILTGKDGDGGINQWVKDNQLMAAMGVNALSAALTPSAYELERDREKRERRGYATLADVRDLNISTNPQASTLTYRSSGSPVYSNGGIVGSRRRT